MAYDHDGDLPDGYNHAFVKKLILDPELREAAHVAAEQNFLNNLGHRGVCRAVGTTYGPRDKGLVNVGALFYEIMTDTPNVGGDLVGTPTWCDVDGSAIATSTVSSLMILDPFDLEPLTYAAVQTMTEDAPDLTKLVEKTAKVLFAPSAEELRRLKMGVGLMRTIHINAEHRLNAP